MPTPSIRKTLRRSATAAIGLAAATAAAPAMAGGFSLVPADTDILYNEGAASIRLGAAGLFPNVSFATLRGSPASSDFANPIGVPSLALKVRFDPALSCALTFATPYGLSSTYDAAAMDAQFQSLAAAGFIPNASRKIRLTTQEYAATCVASTAVGPGRAYLIGGGFLEAGQYREESVLGTLKLQDDGTLGYRVGIGYAIPEYAMRFKAMYRSQVEHDLSGDFAPTPVVAALGLPGSPLPATGFGTLPQSVRLYAQTGIAPTWLVYGSFNWTQWSALEQFDFDISLLGKSSKTLKLSDGYTSQVGVGHSFTDKLSGTVNLTYDARTGSSAFILPSSVALGAGLEYKTDYGKIAGGLAIARISGGSQSFADGAMMDATVKPGWGTVAGLSYSLDF